MVTYFNKMNFLIISLVFLVTLINIQCMPNEKTIDDDNNWINIKPDILDSGKGGNTGDTNNSNNNNKSPPKNQYTLKFVPLIRIIASYIPRLLSRFTRLQGARSLNDFNGEFINSNQEQEFKLKEIEKIFSNQECSTQHLGRWGDPNDPKQFFECAINVESLSDCNEIPPNVTEQIIQDINMTHKRLSRSIISSPTLSFNTSPNNNKIIKSKSINSKPVVVYKINSCVSLILHICKSDNVYSSRLQNCTRRIN